MKATIDATMGSGGFELSSHAVGAMPVINALLARVGIDEILDTAVRADPRAKMAPSSALGVVLRNLIAARSPLYALGEWARSYDPAVLGLSPHEPALLNDDRVGRALDSLFDCDRAQLATEVVLSAIRGFDISLDELHNDSTSITLQGNHSGADGKAVRGTKTAKVAYGHNKDYRPDLKQLLWVLTVSSDGAVPIHYRVHDGNTNDCETHTEVWDTLVAIAGRADFLYVADSKLATRDNMDHIDKREGRFLTVMPRSRSEDSDFRKWVQSQSPEWVSVRDDTVPGGPVSAYLMAEAPWPSAEGYRVAWVLSTSKARRDADSRRGRIAKASQRLDDLATRLSGPKARIRTKAGADDAARAILKQTRTERFFEVSLEEVSEPRYRQERRGRPGPDTRYQRQERVRIALEWKVKNDVVAYEAKSDGMFPFITNCRDLALGELLDHYKFQPCLERRHEQLKSGLEVVPMWLKSVARTEAVLFLFFVALIVRALIEREIRTRMKDEGLATLPLYPEERDCPAPTAERILSMFDTVQRHELVTGDHIVQIFEPQLTPIQRKVLKVLGLSPSIYRAPKP